MEATAWHALPADSVLKVLRSSADGLSEQEAAQRLDHYGPNALESVGQDPWWQILARQFASVVVLLLVGGIALAIWNADHRDAVAIGLVLTVTIVLGFVMELRARRSMEGLLQLDVPWADVVRGGRIARIDARLLVPGDVVELSEGQTVSADLRLLAASELRAVEAALTGESVAVLKDPSARVAAESPLPDRPTMLYKGTTLASGVGRGVVVTTGMQTEVGRIGRMVGQVRRERAPLERRLDVLGRWLALLALVVGVLVAASELWRGAILATVLQTGVAVAVAAVPEALPAVVTIAMAIGMRRMSRRRAVVRRLSAVETLGSATVICADKTGTITEGRQSVRELWLWGRQITLHDSGPPFRLDGEPVDARAAPDLGAALEVGVLASRANLLAASDAGFGDPTEVALLMVARKAGIERVPLLERYPLQSEIPFSSRRMYMATVHRSTAGLFTMMKGAPGAVLENCAWRPAGDGVRPLSKSDRSLVEQTASALGGRGLRVLALARGAVTSSEPVQDLTLLGLVGITDPPAAGVAETIRELQAAGVRTVMITGDHRETATAIGRAVGLLQSGASTMQGAEVDRLSDPELAERVAKVSVFSRVSPEAKLRIVSALQGTGEVVAMIGDGINDAAALRKADIGVAMGQRGSDAAKEVAGIVLADDRFSTIEAAVREGRVVFSNIQKFIFYLFSCNLAEILALLGAVLIGWPLPATPLQILWLNLVTDSGPALALAFEPGDPEIMRQGPRDPRQALLPRPMQIWTVVSAAAIAAVTITALGIGLATWPNVPQQAVTLSFTTLAIAQLLHLGNARSARSVATPRRAVTNRMALAALGLGLSLQVAAVLWAPLAAPLGAVPLPLGGWGVALGLGALPAVGGQLLKWLGERRELVTSRRR